MKTLLSALVVSVLVVPLHANAQTAQQKRDTAECSAASRARDGSLSGFSKCIAERDRARRDTERVLLAKAATDNKAFADAAPLITPQMQQACDAANRNLSGVLHITSYAECVTDRARSLSQPKGQNADEAYRAEQLRRGEEFRILLLESKEKEEAGRAAALAESLQREAAYAAARDASLAEMAAIKEEERLADVARRKRCGKDYDRIAVGMGFARVRQCAGAFFSVGQVSTRNGVVSAYDGPGVTVHVIGGKVVAWYAR